MVGLTLALVALSAAPAPATTRPCHPGRLVGKTLSAVRLLAAGTGCSLRLRGAKLERAEVQTIARQRRHGRTIVVWLNPLCSGSADRGGPPHEPILKPGPTELVAGLYLVGGPHRFSSAPNCEGIEGTPGEGTITVSNPTTGSVVAAQTIARGHLAMIPLSAGTYSVTGLFADASINSVHPTSLPESVVITSGTTVRQDVYLNIK